MIPRALTIAVLVTLALALSMGIYAWRMRGRAAVATQPVAADARTLTPPASGPTEQTTLYLADDDLALLHPLAARIPLPAGRQERAEELLRALVSLYLEPTSPHPLAPGSEVRTVYLIDPGVAVIDVNSAFANGHRSGILVEELTVASMVQTLAANIPGILRVKFVVDGKERDTLAGHADFSDFYDVSAVGQLVSQMSPGR
jgi:hypothetical protein